MIENLINMIFMLIFTCPVLVYLIVKKQKLFWSNIKVISIEFPRAEFPRGYKIVGSILLTFKRSFFILAQVLVFLFLHSQGETQCRTYRLTR